MFTGPFHIKQSHFPRKNDRKICLDCVTSEMHKFTVTHKKNSNISICGLDKNIKSPCIMCVQDIRRYSVRRGVQYIGGGGGGGGGLFSALEE